MAKRARERNAAMSEEFNNASTPATKGDLDKFTKDTHRILIGITVVLFVGIIGIFMTAFGFMIDAWRFKGETYENLVNQVNSQDGQITNLNTQVVNLTNYIYARLK